MQSYWEQSTYASPTDLLIIGSGLTGLLTAWHYVRRYPNRTIRIVERGPFPFGASTRNAGFACFGSPTEVLEDMDSLGVDDTLNRVEKRVKGLDFYRTHFEPSNFDFNLTGGWEIFRTYESEVFDNVLDRVHYLNSTLSPIFNREVYVVDKDINRFGSDLLNMGFHTPWEGQLHPGKLCRVIEKHLLGLGVHFSYGVEIEHLESTQQITATDVQGIQWKADQCVVATNGLTGKLFPDKDIQPARGQVLLTSPIQDLKWRGTFHLDRGYYYFRNVGNRLLLGGGRHHDVKGERSFERSTTPEIQSHLELLLNELLPKQKYSVDMRWAGTMAFGSENEKAPQIEALSENIVLAARLGGMGVAIAPEVAQEAVSLLS